MTNEKLDWIRLSLSENVGPATFKRLISFFGSATKVLAHLDDWAQKGGAKKSIKIASTDEAERQLIEAEKIDAKVLLSKDSAYSSLLKQISDAPPILFILGHENLLNQKSVAIVGTRGATLNGKNFAAQLGFELTKQDYVVISGMAKGIDRAAHVGALQNSDGQGGTIAVLGTSVDTAYPTENKDIYEQIKERGCLISEFPFGTKLNPRNFPRRNRIISGLSKGVVVIEANLKSGSLITAKEAQSQGRKVMAVPGSPLDPRAAGPNMLIQQGATLISSAKDITNVLDHIETFHLSDTIHPNEYQLDLDKMEKDIDNARAIVLENLSPEMIETDALIRATGLSTRLVSIVLTQLELAGRLEHFPGNRIALIYGDKK